MVLISHVYFLGTGLILYPWWWRWGRPQAQQGDQLSKNQQIIHNSKVTSLSKNQQFIHNSKMIWKSEWINNYNNYNNNKATMFLNIIIICKKTQMLLLSCKSNGLIKNWAIFNSPIFEWVDGVWINSHPIFKKFELQMVSIQLITILCIHTNFWMKNIVSG